MMINEKLTRGNKKEKTILQMKPMKIQENHCKTMKTMKTTSREILKEAGAWCEALTSHIVVIENANGYGDP